MMQEQENRLGRNPWLRVLLGLAVGLTGVGLIWLKAAQKENTIMEQDEMHDSDVNTIPPIDAAAPERFETAAFAMG
jgi:hypothetical protein